MTIMVSYIDSTPSFEQLSRIIALSVFISVRFLFSDPCPYILPTDFQLDFVSHLFLFLFLSLLHNTWYSRRRDVNIIYKSSRPFSSIKNHIRRAAPNEQSTFCTQNNQKKNGSEVIQKPLLLDYSLPCTRRSDQQNEQSKKKMKKATNKHTHVHVIN